MKKGILIFDDDVEILAVCKIILEKNNCKVDTRVVSDNVMDDINEVKPDIILMDFWIPTIGGEAAIKLIKNHRNTQHIPVILFSANNDISIVAEKTNANGFLKKPFEIGALLDIIEKFV